MGPWRCTRSGVGARLKQKQREELERQRCQAQLIPSSIGLIVLAAMPLDVDAHFLGYVGPLTIFYGKLVPAHEKFEPRCPAEL